MGSPTSLVLECRPSATMASSASACRGFSVSGDDQLPQVHRLEDFLNALEEERRKIEAFKRELPLCMQLLHDAIEAYKERLAVFKPASQSWSQAQVSCNFNDTDSNVKSSSDRMVLEEFIPIKRESSTEDCPPQSSICKPSWMKAVESVNYNQEEKTGLQRLQEQAFSTTSKPFFHSKTKSGGAFTPFSRDKQVVQPTPRTAAINPSDLALGAGDAAVNSTPVTDNSLASLSKVKTKPRDAVLPPAKEVIKANGEATDGPNNTVAVRKARRCWSPDLHRRFVNALQQLGGPQVATPKQIRELMKVDGLTNDEVKSHLQKYRLHTRRPSPCRPASSHSPQVVVLGGIWVPPDYAVHTPSEHGPSVFNSSRQHSHVYQTTSSQEHCSALGSPAQMHAHSSFCYEQKPSHSQSSLQGPMLKNGHSSFVYNNNSDDAGREESVGDDGGFENSSCKGYGQSDVQPLADETQEQRSLSDSINANRSHCTSEDETDIENSRNGDTSPDIS